MAVFKKGHGMKHVHHAQKGIKMLKLNLLADWTPRNLGPATMKDIALITALAFRAAGLIFLFLMIIFELLFSYAAG
jgi:hypothetical protein